MTKDSTGCIVDGCSNTISVIKRQLCRTHDLEWKRKQNEVHDAECANDGCANKVATGTRGRARIYCSDQCRHANWGSYKAHISTLNPYLAKDGHKTCGECRDTKPVNEYHKDKKRRDGLYPWCKDCRRVYMGAQRAKRAELSKQEYNRKRAERLKRELGEAQFKSKSRDRYLKGKYGIGLNGYNALLEKQGGGCAICGLRMDESTIAGTNSTRRYFAVDHDHACCGGDTSCGSCVRGVLCHHCNVALGSFKDNPHILKAAIAYLEQSKPDVQPALILPEAA